MNDGGLLRRLMDTLTVDVDQEGQQPRPEEAGNSGGDEVDGGECWEMKKITGVLFESQRTLLHAWLCAHPEFTTMPEFHVHVCVKRGLVSQQTIF